MNEVQQVIFNIFTEFDKICCKHDIPYFAIGGTCIGAVRHKGFIPWDDDMDVAIPIERFEEFIAIARKELPDHLKVFDCSEVEHYRYLFIKIIDTRTTFIEKIEIEYPDTYKGVFLDIMPISGIPDGYLLQKLFRFKQSYYYIMNNTVRYPMEYVLKGDNANKKIWKYAYAWSRIIAKRKPYNFYTNKWLKMLETYPFYKSKLTGYVWMNRLGKLVFHTSHFGKSVRLAFETGFVSCPCNYDSYLKAQFGDYMTLPPEEQRIGVHPGLIDLEKSFIKYVEDREGVY